MRAATRLCRKKSPLLCDQTVHSMYSARTFPKRWYGQSSKFRADTRVLGLGFGAVGSGVCLLSLSSSSLLVHGTEDLSRLSTLSDQIRGSVDRGIRTLSGTTRFVRTCFYAGISALDYKLSLRNLDPDSEEYKSVQKKIHQRCAERLLYCCKKHGGIYNKFGQYVATLNHVLPEEYTNTLKVLHDQALHLPWSGIRRVFKEEFGEDPETFFREFEFEPIAAASLAQVHRAVRHNGKEVAVKLQYPHLRSQISSDFLTMKLLMFLLGKAYPDYEYSWLFPEFEQNIRHELSFRQEGFNASRVSRLFEDNPKVYVPKIEWDLTTDRVLTMEFVRGVKINDKEGLKNMDVKGSEVAPLLSEVFGDMMHFHGFVHCDPHPGNILVRPLPSRERRSDGSAVPQIVLLDHGMYRRLTPDFRKGYCQLWEALVTQDESVGREAAIRLGLDERGFELLSLVFTFRSSKSKRTRLGSRMHDEDRQRARDSIQGTTAGDINEFLRGLPRDVLWVLRATNIVRSLNLDLGGTSRQRFRIMGEAAVRGLLLPNEAAEEVETAQRAAVERKRAEDAESHRHEWSALVPSLPSVSPKVARRGAPEWSELPGALTLNLAVASECTPETFGSFVCSEDSVKGKGPLMPADWFASHCVQGGLTDRQNSLIESRAEEKGSGSSVRVGTSTAGAKSESRVAAKSWGHWRSSVFRDFRVWWSTFRLRLQILYVEVLMTLLSFSVSVREGEASLPPSSKEGNGEVEEEGTSEPKKQKKRFREMG
uniref:ABC1 atypical kinase-like domain-containing protein n=1 Tax=Chromera velia CCMP2878 TaxID=1169474 RepID=A0A0G4FH32_9ALVE|eukprot:Cvel_16786.t1-p1 / transcript=Cvel_16786.t1 / gene=Cvel_16786 / organism=Chromera_velia_CCMP2878 / gene_product=Uncharacterized aarF domain-containing protein, putative / transcript_product=Uncharacterized aarF domain-containing protein, putative / location=Cvel_scaffold1310:24295-31921(+) / protein_length=762 / sequence_SO=supercontig / SO=protein_coding / is_pseudo=false